MKQVIKYNILLILIIVGFTACDATKNLPDGKYLVRKVELDIDDKSVNKAELSGFIRQKPNDSEFEVAVYDWSKGSHSWFKKMIGKLGKPPVIYDEREKIRSVNDMTIEMKNKGYLNADVKSSVDSIAKRVDIRYRIISNEPYSIRNYQIDISNEQVDRMLEQRNKRRTIIKSGDIFDMYKLMEEKENLSEFLRNRGYYTSTEDNLLYLADTTLHSNQADVTLVLKEGVQLTPYRIRKVSVFSGFDPFNRHDYQIKDSVLYKGLCIYYDSTGFLRPRVIEDNILIKEGDLFSARETSRTYSFINALHSVSRANIQYEEIVTEDSVALDCNIYLTPGNIHQIQTGLEGTNKEGDLGIAANIVYSHHNIFNGAEVWGVKLRGAYEFVASKTSDLLTHNFYELGIETTLGFPKTHIPFIGTLGRARYRITSEYGTGFNIQRRPEYTRQFFNLNWKNRWENEYQTSIQTLNLIDVNYVMMPWMSEEFKQYLSEDVNALTRYSYENVFTAGIGYNIILTNRSTGKIRQKLHTIRMGIETSGNFLYGMFNLLNAEKSETGQYNILGNPFAQYVKGDFDFSQTERLDEKWSLAYHAELGMAYPYGNSTILPFETRYYAGGPNSVRGWSTRELGPGSFEGNPDNSGTQVGDMKLEFSLEFRYKWLKWLEPAVFVDAGNIWTLRDYENQPGGMFSFHDFYREIAMGTGIGIRLDLSFLIVRLDAGKKIYDPAQPEKERWVIFDKFKGNTGIYFAIGYPF